MKTIALAVIIGSIILALLLKWFLNKKVSIFYVQYFNAYVAILAYHMEKAYDLIHKDRVFLYSIEGMKPDPNEITNAAKDFSKLVLRLLGPRLAKEFIFIYGNRDTLILNLIEYFNSKFEEDSIRQHAVDNIVSGEKQTQFTQDVFKKE
jgi:hypothetical protein